MKKFFLVFALISLLTIPAFSQQQTDQEILTITTYYPSPYGVYQTLRLYPNGNFTPGDSCTNAGEMSYNVDTNQVYVCNGSNWVSIGGAGAFTQFKVFNSSGSFTIPAGVTRIMVEVWGGGGGGAWSDNNVLRRVCAGGGGGGAGGYGKGIFNVQPGDTYQVTVGAGGAGAQNGLAGGASSFGNRITAEGGKGGVYPFLDNPPPVLTGFAGAGGCATVNFNSDEGESGEAICGSSGYPGDYNYYQPLGANGGAGGTAARGGGHAQAPGGGGGGDYAFQSSLPSHGGKNNSESGGAGRVIVWY